jgi:hypothetical protein
MRAVPNVAACTIARNGSPDQSQTVLALTRRLLIGAQKEQSQP